MRIRLRITLAIVVAPILMAQSCDEGGICERAAAFELHFCIQRVAEVTHDCYLSTGAPCDPAELDPYFAFLRTRVEGSCSGSRPQPAGYGSQMHGPTLANRLVEECGGQIASLAARSFGGPHASVLNEAISTNNAADQACMGEAFTEGAALIAKVFDENRLCAQSPDLLDAPCNIGNTQINIALAQSAAVAETGASCAGSSLEALTGLSADQFVARAMTQADCMTSAGIGDPWPVSAGSCGPSSVGPSISIPARATPTQVVLDSSVWNTRCGDGSPYAFWVELAPAGSPIENVVVFMQGGGVCVFESDCAARFSSNPGLFNATADGYPSDGLFDPNPVDNPFFDWTKVYLPYCNQDVYAGAGATEVFPSLTVHRYGANNVRAALQYVRNMIWEAMYDSVPGGYRPDRMRVVLSGGSAGGFGTLYNLHYPIDDLRWPHTTSVPSAALALDNGQPTGIVGLGLAKFPLWNVAQTLPPYCQGVTCAVGPVLSAAHSQRLAAVPDQLLLQVSNQIDGTQRDTTAFPSTAAWTNAARTSYCAEAGQNGLHYFLDAVPSSVHGGILTGSFFNTLEIAGVTLDEWLGNAVNDPASVVDRVEEGNLVTAFPGVTAFTCPVDP